jgi:hypothetical protein
MAAECRGNGELGNAPALPMRGIEAMGHRARIYLRRLGTQLASLSERRTSKFVQSGTVARNLSMMEDRSWADRAY